MNFYDWVQPRTLWHESQLALPTDLTRHSFFRVNANVTKNVLIRKLVKTTIVSMYAKLKLAKKTYFAKLFDTFLSVVENMSQYLKRYVFFVEICQKTF